MTNLDKIKAEAVERFAKVRTDAIGEMFDNVDKDGIYPTTKFFGKIDAALLSEIDRAVEAVVGEVSKEVLEIVNTDLGALTTTDPYDHGWNDHRHAVYDEIKKPIIDLLQKLSTLNEK